MDLTLARKIVSALSIVATIAVLVAAFTPAQAQANTHSCQSGTCPNQASCEGTNFTRNGCAVQCYVPQDGSSTGELVLAGSATCGAGGGGGGDDGGGDWWCGTYCW